VDTVACEQPRLLVFGPDPARLSAWRHLSRRRYRRAVRALEERTDCLLWAPAADHGVTADTMLGAMAAVASPARRWVSMPWSW
jgi:hypothetical protein